MRWGQLGGVLQDARHLWWDLRPHASFGTLELRVADAQTRVDDAVAIAAVFQSLVALLSARLDEVGSLETHPTERIAENAYRAIRYGVRGWMVDLETGTPETTRARLTRLLDAIADSAASLGNQAALLHARSLVADNGAERQRYVVEQLGASVGRRELRQLVAWLVRETSDSADETLNRHV